MYKTYHWKHIQSHTEGTGTFESSTLTETEALRLLNKWNQQSPHNFLYWVA